MFHCKYCYNDARGRLVSGIGQSVDVSLSHSVNQQVGPSLSWPVSLVVRSVGLPVYRPVGQSVRLSVSVCRSAILSVRRLVSWSVG